MLLLLVSLQGYFGKGVLSRARPDHCFADRWQRELKSQVYDVTTSPSASQLTSMFVSQSTKVFHFLSSARPGERLRPLLCCSHFLCVRPSHSLPVIVL